MSDLVSRLSSGPQPVRARPGASDDAQAIKRRIELGYLHIEFTSTRGGTELGVSLNPTDCDYSQADFEAGTGTARFTGHLNLDGQDVVCQAKIDLATLEGTGQLLPG